MNATCPFLTRTSNTSSPCPSRSRKSGQKIARWVIAALAVFLPGAYAQSLLNVDFGVGSRSLKTGFAAIGQATNDFWNLYRHYDPKFVPGEPLVSDGTMAGLKQADGSSSRVTISVTNAPGVWGNGSGDPMYDSYIFSQNGSNITVTINHLEAGHYQFYLYGHADADVTPEQNSVFTLQSGTNAFGPLAAGRRSESGFYEGPKASAWPERYQYVVFRDVPVAAEKPVIIEVAAGPNGVPVLNGMQIISRGTSPPRLALASAPKAPSTLTNVIFREIRYQGKVSDTEARFSVNLDVESLSTNEISGVLFEGDVAVLNPVLPENLRIVTSARQYRLFASAPGEYAVKLDLVAKITRAAPWNEISFVGPNAAIASVKAEAAAAGVEMQLLSGTQLDPDEKATSKVAGFLGSDRMLSMRWQGKTTEIARKSLVTVDTAASAQITPSVIKYTTQLRYEILQAGVPRLSIALPKAQSLTRVQGEQIRDWQIKTEDNRQLLSIEFIKPVEKTYSLILYSEQTIDSTPATAELSPPQPLEIEREAGSFSISADDMLVEIDSANGLRQVNAASGTFAAYKFSDRPFALVTRLRRIEPVVKVADRVSARLEETRLLINHGLTLKIEKAGIYSVELTPQTGFTVADVRGEGVEDWKLTDGKLRVSFGSRVLGARRVDVQLEQALKEFPAQIVVAPLPVTGATNETAQVGAAASLGIRLKTAGELTNLREISVDALPAHADELLAFSADQGDWKLTLAPERLAARIVAEVFNLMTIGDGLVGGSATIRYGLINQGVQEFQVRLPAHWKNVEFTGPNIRRKDQAGDVWTLRLQDKAWGGYTLVVTYDYQFDPKKASLDLSGAHALNVERETGSIAITTAANLKLQAGAAADPLRVIDQYELAETDRALISRPVLLAYRYTGDAFKLGVDVTRHQELSVLDAVADRTQITSVLTESGEMLTQASFMVKNNDKQFQRFQLPKGAKFWACYVNNQPSKAESDGDWLAISLPRGANRDVAFAVDLVYAQKFEALTARLVPQAIQLTAPRTDVPNTYAEWQLFAPPSQRLSGFGGTMNAARGTTYSFRDAWNRFVDFYEEIWIKGGLTLMALIGFGLFVVALIVQTTRRGKMGAVEVLVVFAILAVLAGTLLPALSTAKSRAQRVSAVSNLKQIGLAATLWANDNGGVLPATVDQFKEQLGSEKPLLDPETGRQMVYVGAGKRAGDPNAVVAYSPNGSVACFADGRVEQLTSSRFAEVMQRDAIALVQARNPTMNGEQQGVIREQQARMGGAPNAPIPAPAAAPGQFLAFDAAPAVDPATGLPAPRTAGFGGGAGGFGQAAAPTAAGIRSIRIDVPRSGQVFMFTKVLNVVDEPLSVQVAAMRLKWHKIWRSVLQLVPFLVGLGLLWRQRRLAQRSSLAIALGLALSLTAVGSLLISLRALHLIFIAGVPVIIGLIVIWLLWRSWPRKGRAPSAEPVTHAPDPTQPGSAPAVPLIILALLLGFSNARAQEAKLKALDVAAVSNAVSIVSANYSGNVREKVARFNAEIQVTTIATNQTLPLFGEEIAIEEFSSDSKEVQLLRQGKSIHARLIGKGNANLKFKLVTKLGGDVTKRQLAFSIPPALSSKLSLVIDENDAEVEFPSAVSFDRKAQQTQTRVEAIMGSGDRVEMYWTPRVKRINEMSASIFAQNHSLVTVGGGVLNVRAALDYQIAQGELRQAKVRIPSGQRLLRVDGESIRTWEINTEGNEQLLTVDLVKGISSKYRLVVETEKLLDKLPAAVNVQIPHVMEVIRETGLVALRGGDELTLTVENAADLQRVDASEFLKAFSAENVISAYRFLKGGFTVAARAEPVQPQIEAVARNSIRVEFDQISIASDVDYTIKKAGLFNVRLAIPAGYKVDSVSADHPHQWIEKAEPRLLEVSFKERVTGTFGVHIALSRLHKEPAKAIDVVSVHPLDAQKLTSFVAVSSEAGIAIKTTSFDALTEIPASSLPAAINPSAPGSSVLAFKFIATAPQATAPWKLSVATETVESWVRAEVVNAYSISETLVSGRANIRYDIQNAPLKQFRLKIPAAYTNVEIVAPNIRRRDQNGEEWTVELQNKIRGVFSFTVLWEQNRPSRMNTVVDLLGVETAGVEREVGFVVVLAKAPLQVAEKMVSDQLVPIDARELPDWAGVNKTSAAVGGEAPVLVYRYLRPGFKFAVEARRFEEAAVLRALIDSARLTTVVADDGQMMTEMTLGVRNNGLQHLEIELPKGARVWSAFVAGQPVRPSLREGKLMLPLDASATDDSTISVDLIYAATNRFPKTKGEIQFVSPQLDVPLKNARWEVYLPPDYDYGKFEGSMTHEAELAPSVQVFSSSEYNRQETEKKEARRSELKNYLSSARRSLSSGKLKGANEDLGQAFRLNDEDADTKQELEQLKKDITRVQSTNLINAQRAYTIDNNARFNPIDAQPAQQAAKAADLVQYDASVAARQWEVLQRAQEISVAKVQPLHVNLPKRGVRHAFSQVLQTEINKPMTVQLTATNTRQVGWFRGLFYAVGAFVMLWICVSAFLNRTPHKIPATAA